MFWLKLGLVLGLFENIEVANIGLTSSSLSIISAAVRDTSVCWRFLDLSRNRIDRAGLNELFWALRINRHFRVLRCDHTHCGPLFGTNDDALLRHGVSIVR